MAEKDMITKKYMSDPLVFADVFNYFIHKGKQVIRPENLHPVDTTQVGYVSKKQNKSVLFQRFRDVLKELTIMQDDKAKYILLGIENQSKVDKSMPVRCMLYDAMQYIALWGKPEQ